MKLFIDSAEIKEIIELNNLGIINGVTTNPSIIAQYKKHIKSTLLEICNTVNGPISAEVINSTYEEMLKEAYELHEIHSNIVIKLPLTENGIKATNILRKKNIKTNITLCFSATQAILAAQVGTNYISPFLGRLDDLSYNGIKLIKDIIKIYNNYSINTEIICASIRNPIHILECAKAGAHIATCPYKLLKQLFKNPLTDFGLKKFLEDWKKNQNH